MFTTYLGRSNRKNIYSADNQAGRNTYQFLLCYVEQPYFPCVFIFVSIENSFSEKIHPTSFYQDPNALYIRKYFTSKSTWLVWCNLGFLTYLHVPVYHKKANQNWMRDDPIVYTTKINLYVLLIGKKQSQFSIPVYTEDRILIKRIYIRHKVVARVEDHISYSNSYGFPTEVLQL